MRDSLIAKVRTTELTASRVVSSVCSAPKVASLSSCKSLLYPLGSPLSVTSHAVSWPIVRPALPRASSRGSGFFFCGIMLLPVLSRVGELEEPVLLAAEDDEILGQPAHMHHRERACKQEARDEVTIRRGIEAIADNAGESQATEPGD